MNDNIHLLHAGEGNNKIYSPKSIIFPLGQHPRGIWYSWVNKFSYFLNPHQEIIFREINIIFQPSEASRVFPPELSFFDRKTSEALGIHHLQATVTMVTVHFKHEGTFDRGHRLQCVKFQLSHCSSCQFF
jgi:hypothetical protein